ncbi:MAG: DNA cytosine methyltransferase [Nannocystales bacterium]
MRPLRVAGLFAGIGGFELGMERAKHETVLLCESDPAASAVLAKEFGHVRLVGDVRELKALPKETDVVTAGFPCQDLSQAGQTKGIRGAKSGLVGEVFRLARARPIPWLVLENVPFMLQLSRGRALEVIVSALEELGYKWAYRVVDSRAFGLPQRRERVFIVASLEEDPRHVLFADDVGAPDMSGLDIDEVACGFYWTEGLRGLGWAVDAVPTLKGGSSIGIPSPPAIRLPAGTLVKPHLRDAERMQGFRAGWTRPAATVGRASYRWRLVGNAVSVPVAKWIGRRLANPAAFELALVKEIDRGRPWPRAAWNVGDGRRTTVLSAWPVQYKQSSLVEFLRHEPTLLSERATAGFLSRTTKAKLRFPPGFIKTVRSHLDAMRAG